LFREVVQKQKFLNNSFLSMEISVAQIHNRGKSACRRASWLRFPEFRVIRGGIPVEFIPRRGGERKILVKGNRGDEFPPGGVFVHIGADSFPGFVFVPRYPLRARAL
jgi:hypothetical protein